MRQLIAKHMPTKARRHPARSDIAIGINPIKPAPKDRPIRSVRPVRSVRSVRPTDRPSVRRCAPAYSSNNSQRLSCGSSGGAYTPFMPRHVSFDERSSGAPASGSLPGYSCRVSASSPGSSCAGGGSGGSGPRDASSPKAIAMRWLESSRVSLGRRVSFGNVSPSAAPSAAPAGAQYNLRSRGVQRAETGMRV